MFFFYVQEPARNEDNLMGKIFALFMDCSQIFNMSLNCTVSVSQEELKTPEPIYQNL